VVHRHSKGLTTQTGGHNLWNAAQEQTIKEYFDGLSQHLYIAAEKRPGLPAGLTVHLAIMI